MTTMDTSGFSQVGRYGTISLMKRSEPNAVITSFGVDSEELTFGRDPGCSVRLYYPDVSLIHCKIVFEDRKAFLMVLGPTGLLVDGCKVFSNPSSTSPNTIPLSNNSEIEIHNKRFKFSYPPKELRAALFASPVQSKNRALRLSMIHSAQVFSPRPSKDPRENLRILQSPLKNTFKSPTKPSHLSRTPTTYAVEEDEFEDEEIVLVNGNNPRVVEEERDLVILEDVELEPIPSMPIHQPQSHYLQPLPQTPPQKRSLSRNTLHRAVLIRSAQRAVMLAEKEKEEEEEELEVLGAVAGVEDDSLSEEEHNMHQADTHEGESEEPGGESENDLENEDQPKPLWRKSLERIWPFGVGNSDEKDDSRAEEHGDEYHDDDEEEHDAYEESDQPAPLPSLPLQTPVRRPLGSFMTPQARGQTGARLFPHPAQVQQGRYSLGGEARRIPIEQTWRVKDIVLPIKPTSDEQNQPNTPVIKSHPLTIQSSPMRPSGSRQTLTEDERKAIQERRRSALREVDTFFSGGVPGMTPSKSRQSLSPTKSKIQEDGNPFDRSSSVAVESKPIRRVSAEGEEEVDTRSLLERMKDTVESMKRRRSIAPGLGSGESNPFHIVEDDTHRIGANVSPNVGASPPNTDPDSFKTDENEETEDKENKDHVEPQPFSLLRPGVKEEPRARRQTILAERPIQVEELEAEPAVSITTDDEATADEPRGGSQNYASEIVVKPRGRKATREASLSEPECEDVVQEEPKRIKVCSVSRRTPRPKTPLPENDHEHAEEDMLIQPARATGRRTRKTTAEPEDVKPAPRRGRKPTAEPEDSAPTLVRASKNANVVGVDEKAGTRRGRKAAIKDSTQDPRTEASTPVPASSRRTIKAAARSKIASTRTNHGTKMNPIQADDDDDDPLDSLNAIEEDIEEPAPIPKTRSNRKKTAVKEEEQESAHKSDASKTKSATKPVVTKTPATKTRRKVPASAPAAIDIDGKNKENAQSSGTVSPPVDIEEGAVVKIRVSRTRTKAAGVSRAAKVKEEPPEPTEQVAGRVMRSRTRTKTG